MKATAKTLAERIAMANATEAEMLEAAAAYLEHKAAGKTPGAVDERLTVAMRRNRTAAGNLARARKKAAHSTHKENTNAT